MGDEGLRITWEQGPSVRRAVFSGVFSTATAASARDELLEGLKAGSGPLSVDLTGVSYLDSAGTAVLLEVDRAMHASGERLEINGADAAAAGVLSLVDWEALVQLPRLRCASCRSKLAAQVGAAAFQIAGEVRHMILFSGALAISLVRGIAKRRVRWKEVFRLVETSGVDAAPIVALISMLIGLIMAFLGALQLRKYGASIYVADGVALAMVRELGPIMTAVLVAGRSGSGFAAEIGSMAVDDQVDALVVMGFDPVAHLAVPRVLAVVIAMPCLAMLASLTGIGGGLAVGVVQLDLPASLYLQETRDILSLRHVAIGLVKSVFFGLLVAAVGCYKGLGVRGGAEQVGRAATSAVVTGIFLIVLADALFAIVVAYLPF